MSNKDQTKQDSDKQEFFEYAKTATHGESQLDDMNAIWQWIEPKKAEWQREAREEVLKELSTHKVGPTEVDHFKSLIPTQQGGIIKR